MSSQRRFVIVICIPKYIKPFINLNANTLINRTNMVVESMVENAKKGFDVMVNMV